MASLTDDEIDSAKPDGPDPEMTERVRERVFPKEDRSEPPPGYYVMRYGGEPTSKTWELDIRAPDGDCISDIAYETRKAAIAQAWVHFDLVRHAVLASAGVERLDDKAMTRIRTLRAMARYRGALAKHSNDALVEEDALRWAIRALETQAALRVGGGREDIVEWVANWLDNGVALHQLAGFDADDENGEYLLADVIDIDDLGDILCNLATLLRSGQWGPQPKSRPPTPPGGGERGLSEDARVTARAVLASAKSWEPGVCIIGNVTAHAIGDLCREVIGGATPPGEPGDWHESWQAKRAAQWLAVALRRLDVAVPDDPSIRDIAESVAQHYGEPAPVPTEGPEGEVPRLRWAIEHCDGVATCRERLAEPSGSPIAPPGERQGEDRSKPPWWAHSLLGRWAIGDGEVARLWSFHDRIRATQAPTEGPDDGTPSTWYEDDGRFVGSCAVCDDDTEHVQAMRCLSCGRVRYPWGGAPEDG